MSYQEALEAAGAVVHEFREFGSHQGDWWAKVTVGGNAGWINGSYGSCSGCDAFEAEFGWGDNGKCGDHRYNEVGADNCQLCKAVAEVYRLRLAKFGELYIEAMMTQQQAEEEAARNIEWDHDAEEMLAFIKGSPL
jgi:hypothetical protein